MSIFLLITTVVALQAYFRSWRHTLERQTYTQSGHQNGLLDPELVENVIVPIDARQHLFVRCTGVE